MSSIVEKIQEQLIKNNETITCAESCTGGLIASKITSISGSSSIFKGSVVTYCNEIKEQELGVKKQTMIDHGAVSSETVTEMLQGVLKKFDATYAIAVSGVAGPNGGTKAKPVGTVVIGVLSSFDELIVDTFYFEGTRNSIQNQAVEKSFELIFQILRKNS